MLNICGFGCVSPLGNSPELFLQGLRAGVSPVAKHDFSRTDGSIESVSAFISATADATGLIEARKLRRMFRLVRMIAVSARQALKMANIEASEVDSSRIGVIIGTAYGALEVTQKFVDSWLLNGEDAASPLQFMNSVHGILASQVALDLNATGVNLTVNQREISFEVALQQASNALFTNRVDVVIVGAGDELTPLLHETCCKLSPTKPDIPTGEGAACFVLTRQSYKSRPLAALKSVWLTRRAPPEADLKTGREGINHSCYWGRFPTAGALQFAANLLMLHHREVFQPLPHDTPDIVPSSIVHAAVSTSGNIAGYHLQSTA